MIKRALRRAVRWFLGFAPVRRVFESELARMRTLTRAAAVAAPAEPRIFVDQAGTAHELDPAHRDRLKPQWRTMLDPVALSTPPTDEVLAGRARKAASVVAEAMALVATTTGSGIEGRVLEIGCYDGAAAFQLISNGATEVVASDLARYYVVQRPGEPSAGDIDVQQTILAELRERARVVSGVAPGRVDFIEDDITGSRLAPASFDAIVSFEVLEHLREPEAAFAAMARLLRPGGVAYHDYNPFFSINGGHSLCTLDFPWGHARLDPADFERYVREIRPEEAEQALRFYRESLNRMTMADLRRSIVGAGLELVAVIPWADRTLVPRISRQAISEVRRSYPGAAADDLLATFVSVVARRPDRPA